MTTGFPHTVRARLRAFKFRLKALLCLVLAGIRAFFLILTTGKTKDKYGIKVFYLPRSKYIHLDASSDNVAYQDRVYRAIKEFFIQENLTSLLDIGCGNGYKTMKYFGEHRTLGLEVPPALNYLQETYPGGKWQLSDFSTLPDGHYDMVMSVDVIEHLLDPNELMRFIAAIDCKYIALSTPDRSQLKRASHTGPPRNAHHIREWSREEFTEYVSRHLKVIKSGRGEPHEHYVICEK